MATKYGVVLLTVCLLQGISATLFGYAPDEPVGGNEDRIAHARGKIQKLGNNFIRLSGNAKKDGDDFIASLQTKAKDQQSVSDQVNAQVSGDDASCVDSAKSEITNLDQQAATDNENCVSNAKTSLQPYYQHLDQMVAVSNQRLGIAQGNVSDCVNKYSDNTDELQTCLEIVKAQVFDGRDKLMAAILSEMADFSKNSDTMSSDFDSCQNKVEDEATTGVNKIITEIKACKGTNNSSSS